MRHSEVRTYADRKCAFGRGAFGREAFGGKTFEEIGIERESLDARSSTWQSFPHCRGNILNEMRGGLVTWNLSGRQISLLFPLVHRMQGPVGLVARPYQDWMRRR